MLPNIITKSLTAPSANCIAQTQSVAAAGSAVLNGGSVVTLGNGAFGVSVTQAVLDTQRRIAIVSSGNDAAKTAVISGLRGTGQQISEVLALTNIGTAISVLDYANVLGVNFPTGTAANVTIGTCGTGSTDWIVPNYDIAAYHVGAAIQVAGTVTFNFEATNSRNYFDPPKAAGLTTPQPVVQGIVNAGSVTQTVTLGAPATGYRITNTAGTGTVSAQIQQSGIID